MLGFIIFALIIGVIWLEIMVFAMVGDAIGVLLTIVGIFVTAAIGIRLFRLSGRATMARMAESVQAGKPPILDVADGMAIMLAAGLLLIPGYATDALGLALFIPGLRVAILIGLYGALKPLFPPFKNAAAFKFHQSGFSPGFSGGFADRQSQNTDSQNRHQLDDDDPSSTIIEGDYERKDKD